MNKFERLNMSLLKEVKQAFVRMPAESGPGPVAGGGMLTQAQAAPMGDPSMGGGAPMDPSMMGGAPMDPAAGGGAPMDPSAGGSAPMDPNMVAGGAGGVDPSMLQGAGGAEGAADAAAMPTSPTGQIILSPDEFIKIIQALGSGSKPKAKAAGAGATPSDGSSLSPSGGQGGSGKLEAKIDQLLSMLNGSGGGPQA